MEMLRRGKRRDPSRDGAGRRGLLTMPSAGLAQRERDAEAAP